MEIHYKTSKCLKPYAGMDTSRRKGYYQSQGQQLNCRSLDTIYIGGNCRSLDTNYIGGLHS